MQITPEQIFAEAGRMALELRLKDQALAAMEEQNKALRDRLASTGAEHADGNGDVT